MTAYIAAADFEGSGSLQYHRPELVTGKEIRIVMRDWTRYVPLSNAMSLSAKLTVSVPADLLENKFEAKENLQTIRTNIRSAGALLGPDDLRVAEDALQRLQGRVDESIGDWAESLGKDISSRDD